MESTTQKNKTAIKKCSPGLDFEKALWNGGLLHLAGLDEAGRGAWAGPVAAAAVILPWDRPEIMELLKGVRDSKQMTALQRAKWARVIRTEASFWGVGLTSCVEIDAIGILRATRLAMGRALAMLPHSPDYLLLDAVLLRESDLGQTALIKGEGLSMSIAAASVLAKTARDEIMTEMEELYPGYGFCHHKGYGTAVHQKALLEKGACEIHRRSFEPIKAILV